MPARMCMEDMYSLLSSLGAEQAAAADGINADSALPMFLSAAELQR